MKNNVPASEISETVNTLDVLRQLPPCDKRRPREVKERIDYYFTYCSQNGVKPSTEGLCLALGLSRQNMWKWETDGASEAGELIRRAKQLINALLTDWTMQQKINPVYAIWLQKNNFQYSDSKTLEITAHTENEPKTTNDMLEEMGLVWDETKGEFISYEQ